MRISGNLLVYNELRYIDQALDHLLAHCDEVVVLDGGSTDGTQERIKQRGDTRIRLIIWPQDDNRYFGDWNEVARRNLMIEASSGDYILTMDADELYDDAIGGLLQEIRCGRVPPTCYFFPTYHFFMDLSTIRINTRGDRNWYPNYHVRLFPRSKHLQYKSTFDNGLHSFLFFRKVFPILRMVPYDGDSRLIGGVKGAARRTIGFLLGLAGMRLRFADHVHLCHYHYAVGLKENDLRSTCAGKQTAYAESYEECRQHGPETILLKRTEFQHPAALVPRRLEI